MTVAEAGNPPLEIDLTGAGGRVSKPPCPLPMDTWGRWLPVLENRQIL